MNKTPFIHWRSVIGSPGMHLKIDITSLPILTKLGWRRSVWSVTLMRHPPTPTGSIVWKLAIHGGKYTIVPWMVWEGSQRWVFMLKITSSWICLRRLFYGFYHGIHYHETHHHLGEYVWPTFQANPPSFLEVSLKQTRKKPAVARYSSKKRGVNSKDFDSNASAAGKTSALGFPGGTCKVGPLRFPL